MSSEQHKDDRDKDRRLVARWDRRPIDDIVNEADFLDVRDAENQRRFAKDSIREQKELQEKKRSTGPKQALTSREYTEIERQKAFEAELDNIEKEADRRVRRLMMRGMDGRLAQYDGLKVKIIVRLMKDEDKRRERWWMEGGREEMESKNPHGRSGSVGKKG